MAQPHINPDTSESPQTLRAMNSRTGPNRIAALWDGLISTGFVLALVGCFISWQVEHLSSNNPFNPISMTKYFKWGIGTYGVVTLTLALIGILVTTISLTAILRDRFPGYLKALTLLQAGTSSLILLTLIVLWRDRQTIYWMTDYITDQPNTKPLIEFIYYYPDGPAISLISAVLTTVASWAKLLRLRKNN